MMASGEAVGKGSKCSGVAGDIGGAPISIVTSWATSLRCYGGLLKSCLADSFAFVMIRVSDHNLTTREKYTRTTTK